MSPKAQVPENLRATRRRVDTADHFRLMADYAPVMIWLADSEGRSVYFNRQWLRFRGRTLEEELGLAWLEGVHPEDRDRCLATHFASLDSREPFEMDCRLQRADGEHRRVRVNGVPIIDGKRLAGFVGSCVDMTDQLAAQERENARRAGELQRERGARVSAEAATLARDQFLAIVSHELRSPLNGIKSWTHVLENQLHETDDPTMRRAIDGIMIGVEQQVRLIDDLLDMTRALSGNLGLAKQPMALAPSLLEAVEGLRAVAAEKGVRLIADGAIVDAEIHGDSGRVHQIFSNLVSNAIKFTPPGGSVWVSAAVDGGMARVEVRDDGAGIPAEFLPYVFDPFRQAEQATASNRRQQGLGLGLALVQRLAELHGGHVACESAGRGRGATFRVHLPLRRGDRRPVAVAPDAAKAARALPSLAGIKVMVVDDQREHRESLGALLEQAGASVVLASSGQEALNRLERQKDAAGADVIVCDIAMPTDDGYATLARIRAWELSCGAERRPVIAISAFSERQDRLRALNAGFQMHLTKPVVPAELIVVIASMARGMQRV
jgi:PAS domain S-box-containing protein